MEYYLAYDDGNIVIRSTPNAEKADDFIIERFDKNDGKWVTDYSMCAIYTGDIPVRHISENEAENILKIKV